MVLCENLLSISCF